MKVTDFVNQTNTAHFSWFRAGVLYYCVNHLETGDTYSFPIPWEDLAGATVGHTEKSVTLMRWIRKAIEEGTLTKE